MSHQWFSGTSHFHSTITSSSHYPYDTHINTLSTICYASSYCAHREAIHLNSQHPQATQKNHTSHSAPYTSFSRILTCTCKHYGDRVLHVKYLMPTTVIACTTASTHIHTAQR